MAVVMYFKRERVTIPLEIPGYEQDILGQPLAGGEVRGSTGQIFAPSEFSEGSRIGGKTHAVDSRVAPSRTPPPIGARDSAEITQQTPSPPAGGTPGR